MGSACQAGMDGPSHKDVRGVENGTLENGHVAEAHAEEWREKQEDLPNGHCVPTSTQHVDEQKEQQEPAIRWERFLPVKTLRVLLVENDECTRQVVTALLRKCCYEVIPAENGLHAWQHLEDLQSNIDLVLTEVFMPCLSGIGLLSKITSHKICKDIPVIMMSLNDSMSMVFKCLSKGAVDFLVKPLRKNELKNLWQHVWRRCHSSSGSESGIQTQKCANPKAGDEYENNSDSSHDDDEDNDDDDDFSIGLNARDGSDNGSGTQSSWTKRAVEIDSPQPMSPDQLADPHDSTCAQVIHPKSEICSNKWFPTANKRNGKKQKENNDESMGKYLEIGAPRNSSVEYQSSLNDMPGNHTEKGHEIHMDQSNSENKVMVENDGENILTEPNNQTVDLISSIARNAETNQAVRMTDIHGSASEMLDGNDKNCDSHVDMMSNGLGLKRLKTTGASTENHDEQNILRRSDLSAFTRYHTSVASNQGGAGYGESCSPQDNSSEPVKTDSTCKMMSNSDAAPIKQGSNGSSNNNDMGSSTKSVVAKPSVKRERVTLPSAVKSTQHTSAFHPVQQQTLQANNVVGNDKADEGIANAVKLGHQTEVPQSCVQHHHHVHYYLHVMAQQQPPIDHGSSDAQCGSSNVFDPPVECHAENYSVNGAISGSHNGSTGKNGCSAPNIAKPNMESVNGIMAKNGAGGGSGSGSGSGNDMHHNRNPRREAALSKFRLKRKDRNFSKQVRYQSRKKTAEQRPRVRGQFVRLTGQGDQTGQEADR